MSCRTGPLRVGRAFTRPFNLSRRFKLQWSSRWSESSFFRPTGGPLKSILQDKIYTPRSGRPTRSGPVRQDISSKQLPKSSSYYAETPDCSSSSPAYPSAAPSPQPATTDSAPCAESRSAGGLPSESAALPYAYRSAEYRLPGTPAYPPACDPELRPYCPYP